MTISTFAENQMKPKKQFEKELATLNKMFGAYLCLKETYW